MNRTLERKKAFEIIFSIPFNKEKNAEEIIQNYLEYMEIDIISDYIRNTVQGVLENLEDIDKLLSENIKNRKLERLDNICLAVMRLAVYEMKYNKEIPVNVAINEAIEITKLYDDSLAAFVHANLGLIAKTI